MKRGDVDALQLLGYGKKPSVAIEKVRFEPSRVVIGGRVTMTFVLLSRSRTSQSSPGRRRRRSSS